MHIYTVHYRPASPSPDRDTVLVREGFCWPAFLFTFLWALWHRMWLAALVILAGFAVLALGLELAGADPLSDAAATLGLSLIVGYGGNGWRRARMATRGYRMAGVVVAPGRDAAMRRYFDLNPEAGSARGPAGPPLGTL